ncbi:MAG: excinuclease ABC subunit UvrC [Promethearchaeota archaeon]
MTDLELQRKSMPNEPGVYLFKDKEGIVIYIGKAINLKKRVASYFSKTSYNDPFYEEKIKILSEQINSIEYIITENEKEAYILENILIKTHNPRFNVRMRDSKSYPWVMITYSEEFPRIVIIRGPEKYSKENLFLGPYTDKKEIIRILKDLRKIFPYCTCKKKISKRKRPCLYFQLKLCPGPCIDAISKENYLENIKRIELFLKGETDILKLELEEKMKSAAELQKYELAAYWRDKIEEIDHATSNQNVLMDHEDNKDIIGFFSEKNYAAMTIIHIREGRITNKSSFTFDLREKLIRKEEILPEVLIQYYQELKSNLPDLIIIREIYNEINVLKQILKDSKEKIHITTPGDDNEKGLMRIADKNARFLVEQKEQMEQIRQKEEDKIQLALEEAQKILGLPNVPRIIEGFDISNIEGKDATGSMVYFLEGKPYKKYYRHFKIRSKTTPDDVAMMKEVIRRRYSYLIKNDLQLPDLILVDGGKGQLNAALSVLKDLGIENISTIGLAKRFEEIYVPGKKEPIILPKNSLLLKIFQRVRDEAHRFAVRLHKKQRDKRSSRSILDEIKGVGPSTRNKLLQHFGSLNGVKKATLEQLTSIVGKNLAENIFNYLKKK